MNSITSASKPRNDHPLREPRVIAAIERAASEHRGRPWTVTGFTDLDDRASHPSGVLHGTPFSVFAKLSRAPDARDQFTAERRGLDLITELAGVRTPTPIAAGPVEVGAAWLLLSEAVPERSGAARTHDDFRAIGRTMAAMHQVRAEQYGLVRFNGFFGSIAQDNRPVSGNRWADFYAERRLVPLLRLAVNSGNLAITTADRVERLSGRLRDLTGPDPAPSLLHGDAQQNNFICGDPGARGSSPEAGTVVIDAAPYFGHPEIDLALVDIFEPVPDAVFEAYQEIRPIDAGFTERRDLWRVFSYLAVIDEEGTSQFARTYTDRLAAALDRYA